MQAGFTPALTYSK